MSELSGWGKDTSPFHKGEKEFHERLGIAEKQESIGQRILRPFMPDQHREFFEKLPFMIMGSIDDTGRPWASIVFGKPGFITTPTDKKLKFETRALDGDPLANNLKADSPVSFLGIELPTRRRNRVNAIISQASNTGFEADVVQSFGNCPQYIQARAPKFKREPNIKEQTLEKETITEISGHVKSIIENADSLYVASHNHEDDPRDTGGVDVNHRGGRNGFVKIEGNTLTVPDFIGNFSFNTLGNFMVNPKAGLLFIDYESGDIVQLTGTTEILWEDDPIVKAFKGAERAWRFTLEEGVLIKDAVPLQWEFESYSPNLQFTGNWAEADAKLKAKSKREAWLPYTVERIEDESEAIRSFYLKPSDACGLFEYDPGQFLTIRVKPSGARNNKDDDIIRTYTLSSAPSDDHYRISVKREAGQGNNMQPGIVSNHLHDTLKVGGILEAKAPLGNFTLDTSEKRPAILLAGGVGITPMISMARQAAADGVRIRHIRPMTIFHAVQTTSDRAFLQDFAKLQEATQGLIRYVSIVSRPDTNEIEGENFHFSGRIAPNMLQQFLALDDYDVYICGPTGFMQASYDIVRGLGIPDSKIFSESFGPSSLTRIPDAGAKPTFEFETEPADTAKVSFSGKEIGVLWTPDDGSLLEFAEKHGYEPAHACRNGMCGTCVVKITSGKVAYSEKPDFEPENGEALICCAVPAKDSETIDIELSEN